jgi:glycosyltransferase involved in cell wall biosynthesis
MCGKKMKDCLISVVIPVYNTPRTDIERCLNSVLAQSYTNWEAIIIDDGSKSEIADYLNLWQSRDERFGVFHKKNEGVSAARNDGVSRCRGNFIAFCDADDTLRPNFFEEAVGDLLKYELDLIVGGTCYHEKESCIDKRCRSNNGIPFLYGYGEKSIGQLQDYMLSTCWKTENKELDTVLLGRVYPKLCKAEIVKNVSFQNNLYMHEDNLFSYELFHKCRAVGVTDRIWYDYRNTEYSLVHQEANMESIEQEILFASAFAERKTGDAVTDNAIDIRIALTLLNICSYLKKENFAGNRKRIMDKIFDNPNFTTALKCNIKAYSGFTKKQRIFLLFLKNTPTKFLKKNCLYLWEETHGEKNKR